jgi:Cu+-exporting ATPase
MAAADVSIAVGSGSDVALSSASFILVSSNLSGVVTLVDLSNTVFRRVKFNFVSPATWCMSTADRGLP